MMRRGIPYKIIGGVKFYERMEIKDILAYLRLLINPKDAVSLNRIYNVPSRGLGEVSFKKFKSSGLSISDLTKNPKIILDLNKKAMESLEKFAKLISIYSAKADIIPPSRLIKELVKSIRYEEYVRDGTDEGESRWENVEELSTAARKFDLQASSGTYIESLNRFLEEVALIQDTDNLGENDRVVTLMTMHSAKGLEFPIVFMIGMEDGLFPHSRSLFDTKELEEERRLCYVGITRAQKQLHMTYCRRRNIFGAMHMNPPSRFIFELPENSVKFIPAENISSDDWSYIIET
jgi:DNA helicase-2/ATP-dependent DNA helicase PcrA